MAQQPSRTIKWVFQPAKAHLTPSLYIATETWAINFNSMMHVIKNTVSCDLYEFVLTIACLVSIKSARVIFRISCSTWGGVCTVQ